MKPDPQKLRSAREKHGIDRPTLAAAASVSERTIYSWENGSVRPSKLQVDAIAVFLGCSSYQLCSDDVAPRRQPLPLREVAFVVTCRQCSDSQTLHCLTTADTPTKSGKVKAARAAGWRGDSQWLCPACAAKLPARVVYKPECAKCNNSGCVAGMEGEALDCPLCEVANG